MAQATEAPKKKILVVDPEKGSQAAFKAVLQRAGYNVVIVQSGNEALEKIKSENPDLVVTEVVFWEGINGFDLLERIKANPDTKNIPVIMTTFRRGKGDRERALQAGVVAYLEKPINWEELLTFIERAFGDEEEPETIR